MHDKVEIGDGGGGGDLAAFGGEDEGQDDDGGYGDSDKGVELGFAWVSAGQAPDDGEDYEDEDDESAQT